MERLRDLGQLIEEIREKVTGFSLEREIRLSKEFENEFENYLTSKNNLVDYSETTTVITNTDGQKIYFPNQWFVLAAYSCELVKELLRYREYTEMILSQHGQIFGISGSRNERHKQIYSLLKKPTEQNARNTFRDITYDYLRTLSHDKELIQYNQERLCEFAFDPASWGGGKGIERANDFYESAVLGSLNVVNVSSSYISSIAYAYATNDNLYAILDNMCMEECNICIETNNDVEKDYSAQELGAILNQMYGTAGENLKVASIFMFGLKYAKQIIENKHLLSEILTNAGMSSSYSAELNKSLNIYKCIDQNMYGICFADKKAAIEKDYSGINYKTGIMKKFSCNRILFGAPGTGKSHTLEGDRKELLYGDREFDEDIQDLSKYGSYERVTFHPDYSYAHFVGTYKPVPKGEEISYEYVAGPFIRTLVKALKSGRTENPKPYLLIIEEINRANVAAVFGDVFQLLDRKDGVSEYPVQTSEDLRKYLAEKLEISEAEVENIKIPDNMFIWATMNSADQGVYPMDTAFKRRWDFKYIGIDDGENANAIKDKYELIIETDQKTSQKINWNNLRKAINKTLEDGYQVNEDKMMGPFFISPAALTDEKFEAAFKNKVLMYLCEDVLRHRGGEKLFEVKDMKHLSYAKVCKAFDEKGIDIFVKEVRDKAVVAVSEKNDKAGDAE